MTNVRQLEIWQGDWGLPSIDVHCLQTMAYAKFAGIPLKLSKTNNPWRSPSGNLPVFKQGNLIVYTKFQDVLTHFRSENYSIDFNLSAKQCSEVSAYTALIENKLYPALLYIWWIDTRNYVEFTRPWYSNALPFPLRYYKPGSLQRAAQNRIEIMFGGDHLEQEDLESAIYKDAQECLNLLSVRLGENDFFFGQSPSSLDATVFAYLAPLLKAPFPNNSLPNHLKNCENLCDLVSRVLQRYFPLDPLEQEDIKQKESEDRSRHSTDAAEYPHKRRNQILAGLAALSSMVAYALLSGLIQVELRNEETKENLNDLDDFFDDIEEDHEE